MFILKGRLGILQIVTLPIERQISVYGIEDF